MSLNNNPFSGPNPFPPNEQMPEDQLLTIVQTISHCLHLPLPQNPLTLQFVIKVIRKIFGTHFTGKNWQEAIQFLEREVLGEQEGVIQAQENIDAPNLKKGLHNQEQIYEVLSLLADLALMTAKQDNQQEEIAILKENTKILQNRDSRQRGKKEVKVVERKTKDRQKNTSQRHKEVKNNFPMKTPPLINSSRPKSSTLNQARSKHLPMSSKVDLKMDLQTEVIKTVKQTIARKINTHDMRVCKLMHDQKSDQAVKKAKRTFDYQIKQYRRELKTAKLALRSKDHKTSKYPPEKKQQFVDSAYLKYIKKKHQNIQEEVMSQQLRYYLALRQKKLTYIQHIHKLLSQLQRQRQIDLHKAQREQYQSQKKLAKQKIAATDNIFKNNMEDLKEQFRKRKIENQTKNQKGDTVINIKHGNMFTNSERNDIEQEKNAEAGLKFFEVKVLYNQNSPLSPHYPFNNPIHTKASLLITKSQSNQLCTVGKQSSAQRLESQNISATSDHKQQNRQIAESFSPPKKASLSKPLQTARVRYRELYKQSIDSYFNNRKGNYPLPVFRKTVPREDSGEIPLICRKFINIQKANITILESSSISQRRNYNSFNRDKSRDGRRQRQGVLGSNCISMNIHGKKKRLYDSFTQQNYSARVQSNYVQKRSTKVIYRISNQRIEGISQDQNKSEDQNNNGFTQEYQQELKDTQEPNLTNGRNKEKDKKQFKVYPAPFLMQIRKPITRKQYFVFGLADRTDNQESIYNTYPLDKMESFRDFLWKINYSNGLHVVTPQNLQSSYKAFIGDGNNSYLIRGVLRKRFWWNVVDGPIGKAQQPSIKGQQIAVQTQSRLITDCHFVWTQLKVNEYFSCQKQLNGRPIQQCLSQIQISQKIFPQQVSSETFSSEVHPIVTTFTEPQFLNQGDPHCKIFSPKDYSSWKAHYQKQQKYQRRITIQTYVKRLSLYHKKPMQKIEESQKLRVHNHLQQNFYIGNKKALFYNLVLYYGLQEKDPFKEAIPLTFHVRKGMEDPQYIKFLQIYKQVDLEKDKKSQNYTPRKNIWIVKPGENTNRGTGITVAYHLDDIKMRLRGKQKNRDGQYRTFIIQKYIDKPFLYHRRKFDIRHYVLVCCINGLFKAYWFEEGYIRTSSYEFSTKPNKDPLVHLTNDAIQKNSAQYGKFQRGNKLSYAEFQKYLNKVGKKLNHQPKRQINFFEEVLPQMKRIAIDAVKATYGILDHTRKGHNFQLLGLDFMIDQDFKAWLIQINTNPCLETSSPLLQRIIPSLIDNTFRLTIDPLFPPPQNIPTNRKISSYQNPLSDNKFTLIFDEAYDGQQVQKLFGEMVFGQERIDRRMGDIEQEEDVFEEEGGEKQKLAAEGLGLTI